MTPSTAQAVTFVVSSDDAGGSPPVPPSGDLPLAGTSREFVRLSATRGQGAERKISAEPGRDVVILRIKDGPPLVLHPDTARDLLLGQQEVKRGAAPSSDVRVPSQLQWRGLQRAGVASGTQQRGLLKDVLCASVQIFRPTSQTGANTGPLAGALARKVIDHFDDRIDPGLHRLMLASLGPLSDATRVDTVSLTAGSSQPVLVLLHGTFSDTNGTFGKLWSEHAAQVKRLFDQYRNGVYALEHPTLGVSPIANALALVKTMPKGARMHLLSHSRGGLIAEVLARACSGINLSDSDLAPFAKADGADDLRDLKELIQVVRSNDIRVERVVRVACPARGTLLASRRLDAYLSVVHWLIAQANLPVTAALVDLISEVARCRMDPREAPGLAAQMPDSPLIDWLHGTGTPLPGDLRVVAGDMDGDSLASWIKTLLSDAFFWTDNDLVVQTRSMYGGAPRAADASFVLDRGGKVSHFSYFSNERTAKLIADALISNAPPADFQAIGPLSWAGESSDGVRGADRRRAEPQPEKPAVFLLPGILGSHLKVNGERVWLSWRLVNGLSRLRYAQDQPDGVTPDAPIGMIYDELVSFLRTTHEVIEFPYDWRKPIEEEAKRLGEAVQQALTLRAKSAQPVRIVAHSMGGLLARAMQLECADVWDRMLAHPDSRILMLGTPNGGSWAPMQVLTGDDTFGNALVTLGSPFRDHDARQMMAELPGFLQLQAGLSDANTKLANADTWRTLADADVAALNQFNWWHTNEEQTAVFRWGVPTQAVLDRAIGWYQRLDAQRQKMPGLFRDKAVMVVGSAKLTPCGYESGDRGLTYLHVEGNAGDGRVTLENAALPGVPVWQIGVMHGDLPKAKDCFAGFLELLQSGSTNRLSHPAADKRGGAPAAPPANGELKRWRPSRERGAMVPPRGEDDLQRVEGADSLAADTRAARPLSITVVNANLKFAHGPVMIGHYRGFALTGTERVVDLLIGKTMSESLRNGRYPQTTETQLIFCNLNANLYDEKQLPRPEGVVVIGLGSEGKLHTSDAMASVRQGVIAWSQRLLERTRERERTEPFDFSSVLVGSGGIDVTAGASARFIAEGVWQANQRLALTGWPQVARLKIYELFLDRATEAWRSLQLLSAAMPGRYDVEKSVEHGAGALRRPLESSYRGADYDLISAVSQVSTEGEHEISFTLDTRRARSEVRCVATQVRLLRELVTASSNDQCQDTSIRGALFQLVVPLEIRPFLAGSTEMQIQLDQGTAGIPWELLDCAQTDGPQQQDTRPWAIRSKLIRKLRTTDDRRFVSDTDSDAQMLVIGEPDCDPTRYVRLPGARKEAEAVARLLRERHGAENVRELIGDASGQNRPNARTIITTLLERDWRIVHIAGHGEAPDASDDAATRSDEDKRKGIATRPDQDRRKGVVLSNDTFLGPREIKNMERVPELVFVNCCHLAERDARQLLTDEKRVEINRPQFAASVAEALIDIGVRCVIAAGWAVDDDAAETFATTFYRALLAGERFGDAVGQARDASWRLDGNTWAAYQCYGDANWQLRCKDSRPNSRKRSPPDHYAGVASAPALTLALEALITKLRYDDDEPDTHLERLNYLETRFGEEWGSMGTIAEAFGMACSEAGWDERAVDWYKKALDANDGSACLRAAEQHANLSAKCAWAALRVTPVNGNAGTPPQQTDIAAARERVNGALKRINTLIALSPTMERHNICASAYKRLAMIERFAQQPKAEHEALEMMLKGYYASLDRARITDDSNSFYPALNCLAAELVVRPPGEIRSLNNDLANNAESWLARKNRQSPDFWSVYSVSELNIYRWLADGTFSDHAPQLELTLARLHTRVPSVRYWRIVSGQCEFVLSRFCSAANEGEYDAAQRLLNLLRGWAEEPGQT
ncbi:CHAT domain-containing protein [Paraburkholderia sp. Tr-20389]|uniref:DUF7379 domain-containing protein n=1 Tax=Paraburkholderia sp. Tr-20389 TaxID=2703903 RepID=UPI001981A392|nr:CHAT domain-containing protein [Paraburkholderia sp. Tr-20389]MBN3751481.1 CHAT domain-containing protein [Paraburkholderia sp. Tr-20389]